MKPIDLIKKYFKQYKYLVPAATGIVCMLLMLKTNSNIDPYSQFADIQRTSNRFFFTVLWLVSSLVYVLFIYYYDVTGGRNIIWDKYRYERSYFELLHYYKDSNPYKLDVKDLPEEDWRQSEGIVLGRVNGRLIKRSAFENNGEGVNVGIFGRPGVGKTAAELIISALVYGGSVFALDIKGDLLNATRLFRNIKVFSPEDPQNSYHYNPFLGYFDMTVDKQKKYISNIAAILIPEERDRYWYQTARALFCGITIYMLYENHNTTFPEIIEAILLNTSAPEWIIRIKNSTCTTARTYTDSLYKSNETNIQGAYGTLTEAVRPFHSESLSELLSNRGEVLSPSDLEQGYDIYFEIPQDGLDTYAPLMTIMVQDFMNYFMRRPDLTSGIKQHPILFMLDEFPQFQFDYKTINNALTTFRSKCVSVMVAMQSISQLEKTYGEAGCSVIVDTLSYFAMLSAQDEKSRVFFRNLIGEKKVLKASPGGSTESTEYIFKGPDFSNLGEKVLLYVLGKYIVAEKIYWFK